MSKEFFDSERIRAMERIIQHYHGETDFSKGHLIELAKKTQDIPLHAENNPDDSASDAGSASDDMQEPDAADLSHSHFSSRVQQRIGRGLENTLSTVRVTACPIQRSRN